MVFDYRQARPIVFTGDFLNFPKPQPTIELEIVRTIFRYNSLYVEPEPDKNEKSHDKHFLTPCLLIRSAGTEKKLTANIGNILFALPVASSFTWKWTG